MTLVEAVLVVLLGWPRFSAEPTPETDLERQIRLTQAAIAITGAAVERPGSWQPVRTAAALLAVGDRESKFARYVWAGRCESGPEEARCDPSPRSGRPRARTYWQLHRAACPAAWAEEHGSFAETRAAARCASRLLVGAYYRCKTGHAGAFAGYAGNCGWAPLRARSRANLMARLESRLRQLLGTSTHRPRRSIHAQARHRSKSPSQLLASVSSASVGWISTSAQGSVRSTAGIVPVAWSAASSPTWSTQTIVVASGAPVAVTTVAARVEPSTVTRTR